MADPWVDEPVTCHDPECPEPQPSAQPEMDGDLLVYACPCGYEFPAGRVGQQEGACAAGVPEGVRRRVGELNEQMHKSVVSTPVFFPTIGRRPS